MSCRCRVVGIVVSVCSLLPLRVLAYATIVAWLLGSTPGRALAVGWDSNDFIITGGQTFPDRIGIFDHDFTFKGYLDQNFFGVQGMDFDAQGRLIALSQLNPEVRVYDASGTRVGGFTQNESPMLVAASDLKVSPEGNYVLGTLSNGARVFTPQGTFVRQYGDGGSAGITFVPGRRLWSGGVGTTVRVFDIDSGALLGTFTADQQVNSGTMDYSPTTNTVLLTDSDRDAGGVFERDLTGALLREFHVPIPQTSCYTAIRGPELEVFGTTNDLFADVVRWQPNGTVVGTMDVYPIGITPVQILWAGVVPEPGAGLVIGLGVGLWSSLRLGRKRQHGQA